MIKLKIPDQPLLMIKYDMKVDKDCALIQKLAQREGYELSMRDCLNLWIIYSEAKNSAWLKVDLKKVKKAIKHIESGLVWCND